MTTLQRMTYSDFMVQPEDGVLHELVRGEILRMPPLKGKHGRIEMRLAGAIDRYLEGRARTLGWADDQGSLARDLLAGALAGGEFGIRFSVQDDPDQVRGVDVCYLSPEQVARYESFDSDEYFPEVPVLVAEIISPSETASYINEKVNDYLSGGAQVVWLIFPKTRSVQIYRPDQPVFTVTAAQALDGGDVLPGFSIPGVRLFT